MYYVWDNVPINCDNLQTSCCLIAQILNRNSSVQVYIKEKHSESTQNLLDVKQEFTSSSTNSDVVATGWQFTSK